MIEAPYVSLKELFNLTGRVALITGGSRGLGLQIAEALGEFGARLLLTARKEDDLRLAQSHLAERGIDNSYCVVDMSDPSAPAKVVDTAIKHYGRIDILVNNAGAVWASPTESHPDSGWHKVMNLNVNSVFFLTQLVAKTCLLPAGRGRVLNIASVEGLLGHHPRMTGTIAYNTSKGAIINMTRALAAEWGPKGIAVNALAPGYFPTKLTRTTLEMFERDLVHDTPSGRLGDSNDLKGAALLLCSDAGAHITGQIVVVDGGATII